MRLRLKEDPKEWRKVTWLTAVGLAVLSSLLRWQHLIGGSVWLVVLMAMLVISLLALVVPTRFRGFYRVSVRLGFALSQVFAWWHSTCFLSSWSRPWG